MAPPAVAALGLAAGDPALTRRRHPAAARIVALLVGAPLRPQHRRVVGVGSRPCHRERDLPANDHEAVLRTRVAAISWCRVGGLAPLPVGRRVESSGERLPAARSSSLTRSGKGQGRHDGPQVIEQARFGGAPPCDVPPPS